MTRPDVQPLRQSYHRASVRELLVRARGFELNAQRRLQPHIEARILSFGAALLGRAVVGNSPVLFGWNQPPVRRLGRWRSVNSRGRVVSLSSTGA